MPHLAKHGQSQTQLNARTSTDVLACDRCLLLTLEQLTAAVTVLALHASHRPEDIPRVRAVFEQLLEVIHQAETDMAVFDLP